MTETAAKENQAEGRSSPPANGRATTLFVTVATAKYVDMGRALIASVDRYCTLPRRDFMVLTDRPGAFPPRIGRMNVIRRRIKHLPWPLISLLRYHLYLDSRAIIDEYDYVFHLDSDMRAVGRFGTEILAPSVCVAHWQYWRTHDARKFPYERNKKSAAYVPVGLGRAYFQNCFQGGETERFLQMSEVLRANISYDLRNNHIATVIDESHMNRFMIRHPPAVTLSREYAYPEVFKVGRLKRRLIHLAKDPYAIRAA